MNINANLPRQSNSWDCGIFVCVFAKCLAESKEINFHENEMPYFRRMILQLIVEVFSFFFANFCFKTAESSTGNSSAISQAKRGDRRAMPNTVGLSGGSGPSTSSISHEEAMFPPTNSLLL